MRTTQLVQASANVVTITTLTAGDVYKRLGDKDYQQQHTLHYGVVLDVMHNGEDAVIVALEFPTTWTGAVEPKVQTFGTDTNLRLFEAQPDEVQQHFGELRAASAKAVQKARDELEKQESVQQRVLLTIERVEQGIPLTAAATSRRELEQPAPAAQTIEHDDEDGGEPAPSDEPPF